MTVSGEPRTDMTLPKPPKASEPDPDKDQEETTDPNMPVVTRAAFNMVCYGMPNLIITQ